MKKKNSLAILAVVFLLFLVSSCAQPQVPEKENKKSAAPSLKPFINEKYGFSFIHSTEWQEITSDLPDRWALRGDDENTIVFVVSPAQSQDVLTLGRAQAMRDMFDGKQASELTPEDLAGVFAIIKLDTFNNKEWYTYGIKFSNKQLDSLISGTVCNGNEIVLVLVNDAQAFDNSQEIYTGILESFKC
jgi:hypothetical protein